MCIKEFYGYNCGHCSIPYIRQCPITTADSHYPACEHPAERPIFVNDYCHPCSRVVWNKQVLREEAEHRERHENQTCQCGVIFNETDKARGAGGHHRRSRVKGKGKGKAWENAGLIEQAPATSGMEMALVQHTESSDVQSSGIGQYMDDFNADYSDVENQFASIGATYSDFTAVPLTHEPFPESGLIPLDRLSPRQMMMGQMGAGMKWYPEQQQIVDFSPAPPTYEQPIPTYFPTTYEFKSFKKSHSIPRDMEFNAAEGERVRTVAPTPEPESEIEIQGPSVVSTDMNAECMP